MLANGGEDKQRKQNQIACQSHIIHRIRLHLTYVATAVFIFCKYENVHKEWARKEKQHQALST